jgi:acyl-coenzyme A synthetase/AMP-(fatty) acid ligase
MWNNGRHHGTVGEAMQATGETFSWTTEPFEWRLPPSFNFGTDVVDRAASVWPARDAIVALDAEGEERRFTFAQVAGLTDRLAAALVRRGLARGDRVIVILPRVPEWHLAMIACLKAGIIPIPCVTMLSAAEVEYRLRHAGAAGIVASSADAAKLDGATGAVRCRISVGAAPGWANLDELLTEPAQSFRPAEMKASDPAILWYTSGSSGSPKAVLHASQSLLVRSWQPWRWLRLAPGEVVWATTDMGWTKAATSLLFGTFYHGATAFLVERPVTMEIPSLVARHGISFLCLSATELRRLVENPSVRGTIPTLRLAVSAGEAVTADLFEKWMRYAGTPLVGGYGQTETPMMIAVPPGRPDLGATMGVPFPGNTLAVVDETGAPVQPGESGIIAVRRDNPGLMLGYWNDGRIGLDATIRGEWYLTNDRAVLQQDGRMRFIGRADDVINSSGYRIGPSEVENALLTHPAVSGCAVVASPDRERGEVVKAYIVLHPAFGASGKLASELQRHVKAAIAPYKYPRKIEFVDTLPMTATGKVLRRALRSREFGEAAA